MCHQSLAVYKPMKYLVTLPIWAGSICLNLRWIGVNCLFLQNAVKEKKNISEATID